MRTLVLSPRLRVPDRRVRWEDFCHRSTIGRYPAPANRTKGRGIGFLSLKRDSIVIWTNVAIALMMIPLYHSLGEGFKFLVAPYVLYMVWSRNANFFPALVVHFLPGSTISSFMLVLCLILAVVKWKAVSRTGLGVPLALLLLPLPYFLFQTAERAVLLKATFVELVTPLSSYYLGLFSFYYGVLIAKQISSRIWKSVILVLFLLQLLSVIGIYAFTVRYFFFLLPLAVVIGFYSLNRNRRKTLGRAEKLVSLSILMLVIGGFLPLTFTLVLASLLAVLVLVLADSNLHAFLSILSSPRVIIVLVLVVVIVSAASEDYQGPLEVLTAESLLEVSDMWAFLEFKALGDRGSLWKAGIEFIITQKVFWPPLAVPEFSYVSASGTVFEEVEFGFHNLGLELTRNYGIVFGFFLFFMFVWFLTKGGRLLYVPLGGTYERVFAAAALGTGIAGSLAGQYPLQPTFSFFLLSVAGICHVRAQMAERGSRSLTTTERQPIPGGSRTSVGGIRK